MKFFPLFLALFLAASSTFTASGQGLKIAVVDFKKVLTSHPKAREIDDQLKQRNVNTQKVIETKTQQLKDLHLNMQKVVSQHQGPDNKLSDEGTKMFRELQAKRAEVQKMMYDISTRNEIELTKQRSAALTELSTEIRSLVSKANAGEFVVVLDTSALTLDRTPIVVDASNAVDITDRVIALLPKS